MRDTFYLKCRVKLEGKETQNLVIKGTLVDRTLEVLAMNTQLPIECVQFGSTYYGSDKTECALLFNNGPEPVHFVAVLDEDAVAQEMVQYYVIWCFSWKK